MPKKESVTVQPSIQEQITAASLMYNEKDSVMIRNKKVCLRWINGHATEKVTRIMLSKEERTADGYPVSEGKIACKCAAALRLNGYWKIRLAWWALWRWYYYVRQYQEFELIPLIDLAQKKTPVLPYFYLTTSLTALKETRMNMTREEMAREKKTAQSPTPQEQSAVKDGR